MKEKIKDFIKENWFKVSLLLIVILFLSGAFYWYEWKPAGIRKSCQIWLEKQSLEDLSVEKIDLLYKFCLQEKGLEK